VDLGCVNLDRFVSAVHFWVVWIYFSTHGELRMKSSFPVLIRYACGGLINMACALNVNSGVQKTRRKVWGEVLGGRDLDEVSAGIFAAMGQIAA